MRTLGTLPPWMWFWLVVFLFGVPGMLAFAWQSLDVLVAYGEMSTGMVGALHAFFLSNLPQLITALAVMLGILTVLVPRLRAVWLERRFWLAESHSNSPVVREIEAFVHDHAPNLRIKTNLLRADLLAFVYPLGYRASGLALFGGIVRLWRSDRRAAEAVLLHEVAHHRHGDALILGAGSFFETLARYWLVLGIPPILLAVANFAMIFYAAYSDASATFINVVGFVVPLSLLAFVGVMFWLASALALPLIGGIWSAELNADRFVVETLGTPEELVRALQSLPPEKSWWRWFLFRIFHPPQTLRRWAALRAGTTPGLAAFLLIFPLLYPAKLLAMSAWGFCLLLSTCVAGCGSLDLLGQMKANVGYAWAGYAPTFLAMSAMLLSWPVVSPYWEWLCSGKRDVSTLPRYGPYAAAAAVTGIFCVTSYALRLYG